MKKLLKAFLLQIYFVEDSQVDVLLSDISLKQFNSACVKVVEIEFKWTYN